jgi:glycosyltransferase involved in cell wall biosynthesis
MTYGKVRGGWMAHRHLRCLQQIQKVVFVSHAIEQMFGFSGSNGCVIHNGVDVEHYVPVALEQKQLLRARLGLPGARSIFISTGHLDPRKDPVVAIEGVLAGSGDGLLLLLGDGTMRAALENRYRHLAGRVRFIGRVPNVSDYLQASDYFVSASLAEGLPNAVLEALACGLPCFLSDIPEHREIVAGSDLSPLLFRSGDSSSLSAAIAGQLPASREPLSTNARRLAEESFSQRAMSMRYQALYAELPAR